MVTGGPISIQVDPDRELARAIRAAADRVADLTVPLTLIAREWFKSNRAIFALKSKGKYAELSDGYKKAKERRWGFVYPILKASGDLSKSITDPTSEYAIAQILNQKTLHIGSSIPYGGYHQTGTKRMPARPWVLIGSEQVAPRELNRRRQAWIETLGQYVDQVSRQALGKA